MHSEPNPWREGPECAEKVRVESRAGPGEVDRRVARVDRSDIARREILRKAAYSAFSSASSIMPATLKPVCCAISWKPVGLVTLISVR